MWDHREPWYFRHFNKIFTGMLIFVALAALTQIALYAWVGVSLATEPEKAGEWLGSLLAPVVESATEAANSNH